MILAIVLLIALVQLWLHLGSWVWIAYACVVAVMAYLYAQEALSVTKQRQEIETRSFLTAWDAEGRGRCP
jgi:hypothetical protein